MHDIHHYTTESEKKHIFSPRLWTNICSYATIKKIIKEEKAAKNEDFGN